MQILPQPSRLISNKSSRDNNKSNLSSTNSTFKVKNLIAFFIPFVFLVGGFYVPFFLNTTGSETSGYLQRRVLGGGFMPRTLYSKILMKFYMPKEMIYALVVLSCLSLYFILKPLIQSRKSAFRAPLSAFRKTNHSHSEAQVFAGPKSPLTPSKSSISAEDASSRTPQNDSGFKLIDLFLLVTSYLLPVTLLFTFWFSTQWIKPRGSTLMFYALTIFTLSILFFSGKVDRLKASLFAWFLASSCFYLFFNKTPRTHVYIVFIPMFILSGYTIAKIFSLFGGEFPTAAFPNPSGLSVLTRRVFPSPPKSIRDNPVQIRGNPSALGENQLSISVNPLAKTILKLTLVISFIYFAAISIAYNHRIFV